jgi:predicted nucleic acid-binding protein
VSTTPGIDASILANAVGDDAIAGYRARVAMRSANAVVAPDLVDVETISVLRKRWMNKSLSDERFERELDALEALTLVRFPSLLLIRRAFDLRSNLSPYDAMYVALAELLDAELLTADSRLASAPGPLCAIRVVTD